MAAEAEAILAEIRREAPRWLEDIDTPALHAWASAEARCLMLRRWLDQVGWLDEDGEPRRAESLLLRWEGRADKARQRLGFDPLARMKLGADHALIEARRSDALAAVAEAGRLALAGNVHDQAGQPVDDAGGEVGGSDDV